MLEKIKPILEEKAIKTLPDSLQIKFKEAMNKEELFTPANFKKSLPAGLDGFFYKNNEGKLDFKFIEIGIKVGLQSEIKRFLDASDISENFKIINGIKSNKRK
jgi:HlyD family secretion protein